jgi:hypothetical protein
VFNSNKKKRQWPWQGKTSHSMNVNNSSAVSAGRATGNCFSGGRQVLGKAKGYGSSSTSPILKPRLICTSAPQMLCGCGIQ